jgi:hypothetical protein
LLNFQLAIFPSWGIILRAGMFGGDQHFSESEGKMTMKALLILIAICFSANAVAQDAPPKVGNKPLARVKPKEPMGCKLVGTVKGTKLWAGNPAWTEAVIRSAFQKSPDLLI